MIPVKLVTTSSRNSSANADHSTYMLSGLVNWRSSARQRIWRPPTDVFETPERIVVRVEIAGMSNEDFTVIINQNLLVVQGVRREVCEKRAFHQMEIPFGEFITEADIPSPIDTEQVEATYQDGFLLVVMPKSQTRRIQISGSE